MQKGERARCDYARDLELAIKKQCKQKMEAGLQDTGCRKLML
jgi:hypothetical protein